MVFTGITSFHGNMRKNSPRMRLSPIMIHSFCTHNRKVHLTQQGLLHPKLFGAGKCFLPQYHLNPNLDLRNLDVLLTLVAMLDSSVYALCSRGPSIHTFDVM
jgi:hypothetical protein